MINPKTFAIIGGGIGGLTTAIALQREGCDVRVYEAAPMFKAIGAGIVLAANALKAFREIGIEEEILSAGKELKRFAIRNTIGGYLNTTEAERINKKYGLVNTLTLHRADLHHVLQHFLKPRTVKPAKQCIGFIQSEHCVKLYFSDGTIAEEEFVIAADGIHSVFRKKLVPHRSLRYSGYTCWRAVIDVDASLVGDEASETWGAGRRFGVVPLNENRVYWYATLNSEPSGGNSAVVTKDELTKIFKDFHQPVQQIISLTRTDQLIRNDIFDFKPIGQYAFDNIVLMGDAAHATTPNLGQGACMAIEDAVVLANCIEQEVSVGQAFKQFQNARIDRNSRVVNASYSLGKIAQLNNPVLLRLRNAVLRLTPERIAEQQLKFLYDVKFN
jgi:2-polyprenyl-6-methoxyphenol hydroxylase-like FAD-dependent oxidoreductase